MEETKTHVFVDSRMGVFLGKFLCEEVEHSSHLSVPNHSLSQNQWPVVQPLMHIELNSKKRLNPSKLLERSLLLLLGVFISLIYC